MMQLCLKPIKSGTYTRVIEECDSRYNLGLICDYQGATWLWLKCNPSPSGAVLYTAANQKSFKPYPGNPHSTPRGGTGYLGGRAFTNQKAIESYLKNLAKVLIHC